MATYLITGASRGLGFSLAAALASEPVSVAGLVFLTSRNTNTPQIAELVKRSKGRVVPVQLDPNEPESLRAAVEFVENRVQGRGLDVLVNNAGMMRFTGGKVGEL
jgi:NAD(P)-dependent dehydrogenase (short-subunit alcohol dehydrogenase family)